MAKILYNVTPIRQRQDMTCWYAAACMIANTYEQSQRTNEQGPQHSMSSHWQANFGLDTNEMFKLAKEEGLVPLPESDNRFTAITLIAALRKNGTLWAPGKWYGSDHIVVITGCEDVGPGRGTVFLNDPGDGERKTGSVSWFNMAKSIGAPFLCRGYPPRQAA